MREDDLSTILVTGATGFVGSSLIARLLADGMRVIAVARNDAAGERTRAAVQSAAIGFDLPAGLAASDRLTVLDANLDEPEASMPASQLAEVTAVWHTAAEMSYASQKLLASYQANVVNTLRLYRHVAAHAPQCRRFVHVSTAYVAGMLGGRVSETLHAGKPYVNTYQITKGAAEHALAHAQQASRLPVTLFRPTIIVGHRHSGWTRRSGFGFYMFVEAIASVGRVGVRRLHLRLDPRALPDLISIDALVHDAVHLTALPPRQGVEIFHCSGGHGASIEEVMHAIGGTCGVEIAFGDPQTAVDKRIDRAIEANRPFANTGWHFDRSKLDAVLGAAAYSRLRTPVSAGELRRMADWYVNLDLPAGATSAKARRRAMQAVQPAGLADEVAGVPLP